METINLFNNTLGIQGFLEQQPVSNFPSAKPLASTASHEIAVVEHFNIQHMSALCEKILTPEMGDGSALRPDVFNKNTISFLAKFADSQDVDIKALNDEIIKPMLQNKDLFHAYTNLMVAG